jgi:signal peptidase II
MFYFPLVSGIYPDWVPFWGGEDFQFFRPVFNIADASITCGVFILVLFQTSLFENHNETAEPVSTPEEAEKPSGQDSV